MNTKNFLYAGIITLSVGCDSNKEEDEYARIHCNSLLEEAFTVAKETGLEGLKIALESKRWCGDKTYYASDWAELSNFANFGAKDYCNKKRLEANQLIASNENMLMQLVFQNNFRCDSLEYKDNMNQAHDLQKIIDSYQKK